MANWNLPLSTSAYASVLAELMARDNDAATMFDSSGTAATNITVNTKRWNASNNNWEKWTGAAWTAMAASYGISITGNSGTASAVAVINDTTTNATYYPTFMVGTSGNLSMRVCSSKWTFNPSTGTMSVTQLNGDLNGNIVNPNATATTQSQFDNSTKLATTAFAQAIGIRASNIRNISLSTTLTAADVGKVVWFENTGGTQTATLPPASTVPAGGGLVIRCKNYAGHHLIVPSGTDTIHCSLSSSGVTSYKLYNLDSILLVSDGAGAWYAALESTTNYLANVKGFSGQQSANGHQPFPNGTIIQWGISSAITGGTGLTITYPVEFPNAIYNVSATPIVSANYTADPPSTWVSGVNTSNFIARASVGCQVYWTAIGK